MDSIGISSVPHPPSSLSEKLGLQSMLPPHPDLDDSTLPSKSENTSAMTTSQMGDAPSVISSDDVELQSPPKTGSEKKKRRRKKRTGQVGVTPFLNASLTILTVEEDQNVGRAERRYLSSAH